MGAGTTLTLPFCWAQTCSRSKARSRAGCRWEIQRSSSGSGGFVAVGAVVGGAVGGELGAVGARGGSRQALSSEPSVELDNSNAADWAKSCRRVMLDRRI